MFNEDLSALLDLFIPHAIDQICYCGHFNPFGASIHLTGELMPCVAKRIGKNPLKSRYVLMMNKKFHRDAQSGLLRAAGFCYSMPGASKQDHDLRAVIFALEHQNGLALNVSLPYRLLRLECAVEFRPFVIKGQEPVYFRKPR
jgi:hypothetical protein